MTKCSSLYVPYFSDDFEKNLKKLTRRSTVLRKRIQQKIDEMCDGIFGDTIDLAGNRGKGKSRVRMGNYRLIYAVCSECRENGYQMFNGCYDCEIKDDDSIIYFDVIHRSSEYRQYR